MTITVPKEANSAYKPRVESTEAMRSSLFRDIYQQAEDCVADILAQSKGREGETLLPEYGNIIAFTGGRGTGKTSAMESVAGMLARGERLDEKKKWDKTFFECLPMVDPSHLTKDETVVDVILSRLYSSFERYCEGASGKVAIEEQRRVYMRFEEVYRAVRSMCKSRQDRHKDTNSLEGLNSIAAGNELRRLMDELVQAYLKTVRGGRDGHGCLVVCVDDVDMNVEQGYHICEDLRKYFELPGVVILFSLCIEQMNDIVRQEYLRDFEMLCNIGKDMSPSKGIPNMAAKYLEKLIPFGRRCVLPDFSVSRLGTLKVQFEAGGPERFLVDVILGLMEEKAGIIMVKDAHESHAFLPTNLRGIMHLLETLGHMESAQEKDKWDSGRLVKNLDTLKEYIRHYQIPEFPNDIVSVLKILLDAPLDTLNQYVVMAMHRSANGFLVTDGEEDSILDELIDPSIPPENISIGDVLFTMHCFYEEDYRLSEIGERFIATFRVLYTIRMLETVYVEHGEESFAEQKDALAKLVGGLIYTPGPHKVIRGGAWFENLKISDINNFASAKGVDPAEVLDVLLMNTVCTGKLEGKTWVRFRNREDGACSKSVERNILEGKKGNVRYFSASLLGCFTNCLRSDLTITSDRFKAPYEVWRAQYTSPIPIVSMDFVDEFVYGLYRATLTSRKSGNSLNYSLFEGAEKLIEALLKKTVLSEDKREQYKQRYKNFPFLKCDYLEQFRDYCEKRINPQEKINELKSKVDSLDLVLRYLENAKYRYGAVFSFDQMMGTKGVTIGREVLPQYRKALEELNQQIIKEKQILQRETAHRWEDTLETITEIQNLIEKNRVAAEKVRSDFKSQIEKLEQNLAQDNTPSKDEDDDA